MKLTNNKKKVVIIIILALTIVAVGISRTSIINDENKFQESYEVEPDIYDNLSNEFSNKCIKELGSEAMVGSWLMRPTHGLQPELSLLKNQTFLLKYATEYSGEWEFKDGTGLIFLTFDNADESLTAGLNKEEANRFFPRYSSYSDEDGELKIGFFVGYYYSGDDECDERKYFINIFTDWLQRVVDS